MRPESTGLYQTAKWHDGVVYVEPQFPSLLFAMDGEVYDLDGQKAIVIGGAYSVDKEYRLSRGWSWWPDEQPNDTEKQHIETVLWYNNNKIDIVLSHTCPFQYQPTEMFLPMIDQSTVDTSTEEWLGVIEETLDYKAWYCGHFHTDKIDNKIRFMHNDIIALDSASEVQFYTQISL